MPKKAHIPITKPKSSGRKVTVTLTPKLFKQISKIAENERRTISQQVAYLMDIGLDFINQQMEACSDEESHESSHDELTPAIGFKVDTDEE